MVKAIKILYAINIAIFALLIPLAIFCADQAMQSWTAQASAEANDAGEAIGVVFAAIFVALILIILAGLFIIADSISLVLAIIGLVKICRAKNKKSMKGIAIAQIIFLGNIVPAIMCLKSKDSDYVSSNLEENTLNN